MTPPKPPEWPRWCGCAFCDAPVVLVKSREHLRQIATEHKKVCLLDPIHEVRMDLAILLKKNAELARMNANLQEELELKRAECILLYAKLPNSGGHAGAESPADPGNPPDAGPDLPAHQADVHQGEGGSS